MKQRLLLTAFLATFLITVQPAIASSPVIVGEVSGVELCAQSGCNAAIFTGTCDCKVHNRHTVGFFGLPYSTIHYQLHFTLRPSSAANGI